MKLKADQQKIVENIKRKIDETPDKNIKSKLLTLLPEDWTVSKTRKTFGASERLTRYFNF